MAKRLTRGALIALVCIFVFYALAVYLIDPYMHYHAPWFGLKPQRSDDSRYENWGVARFFDYDALMLGTSVTQDARASEFAALFDCKPIRIKFAGSYFKELGDYLRYAFRVHEGIGQVFMVLDLTHVLTAPDTMGHTDNPDYLCDGDWRNDSQYLLNKDVAPELLRAVLNLSPIDFDWQTWKDPTGRETLLKVYGPGRPEQAEEQPFTGELREQVLANYNGNIFDTAREHPETQFYFVIPPGNAFFWDYTRREGRFECQLQGLETVLGAALSLPNARVFYFPDDEGKIFDLDRYKDRVHFDPAMMSEIISDVAAGRFEVTEETAAERVAHTREIWEGYDYEALYAEE